MNRSARVTAGLWLVVSVCASPLLGQVRLAPEDAEKLAIGTPTAEYPAYAAAARIQGPVIVDVAVSEAGSVTAARLVYGHPLLADAAVRAAKRGKYRPYLLNGRATAFMTIVGTSFTLGGLRATDRDLSHRYFELRADCLKTTGQHRWSEAESVCSGALWMAGQMSGLERFQKVDANNNVGSVYLEQQRFDKAIEYFARALVLVQNGPETADVSYVHRNLGLAAQGLGDLPKAMECYSKAKTILETARSNTADEGLRAKYTTALKSILDLDLKVAQQAGATQEADEIARRLAALP